ncbi:MAG: NnrS family protein [Sulfuritalea sp.]|nr:NnrS family protein [Sulfuritalea sp.]
MQLPIFFAAPHRVMFLSGTVQALAVMAFWSVEVGGRYAGLWSPSAWPLVSLYPPSVLHALLIASGVFPFFIFGFILTAGPRWQGAPESSQRDFLPAFGLLASGWALVWAAFVLPQLLIAGLTLATGGWMTVALTLTGIARHRRTERLNIVLVATAAWLGAAGLGAFLVFATGSPIFWAHFGITLTIWGFLLPIFLSVAHRMLPFFTSSAVPGYELHRPTWALRALFGLSLAHGVLTIFEQGRWLWLADLPAMLVAGRLSWLWWSRKAMKNRMLAVLHIAFAWLSPAFALFAIQSLLFDAVPGFLGQAPLHALTLGFFASMLIGMASRVTMGHSGRPIAADAAMWRAFCLIQTAAILRVVSELPGLPGSYHVMWISSLAWLVAFVLWAVRYAPAFWRPRADGKAG